MVEKKVDSKAEKKETQKAESKALWMAAMKAAKTVLMMVDYWVEQ